ncbi:MAG: hypothetical protein PHV53_04355 [Fermentimonas sp.]|nr:hypothetical protein [Fermentimonas sp.]
MLRYNETRFIKSPFNSESELEQVVIDNYEYLFGPNSYYLPKTLIRTGDGNGTIPDGYAIDLGLRKWYIVEAELMHHSVWNHIVPQVTKQIIASKQSSTKQLLEDLSVDKYQTDPYTKEKFEELNIAEINVRQVVRNILETDPIIGIPIDGVTKDINDWANTLEYTVKLWVINKYVEFNNPTNIIWEFPEEQRPTLDTEKANENQSPGYSIAQYDVDLNDLINGGLLTIGEKLYMSYKPKNGQLHNYEAFVLEDGSLEVLGQHYSSPSYAALAGIQDAGSDRKTVNGWTSWRNSDNRTLADLRDQFLNSVPLP